MAVEARGGGFHRAQSGAARTSRRGATSLSQRGRRCEPCRHA
jgi:hypothetical protein